MKARRLRHDYPNTVLRCATETRSRKQLAFGFLADAIPVKNVRLDFSRPPRWSPSPPHDMGREVACQHPNGHVRIAKLEGRNGQHVQVAWPNAGGKFLFEVVRGECVDRAISWRLSPCDIAWLGANLQSLIDLTSVDGEAKRILDGVVS